MKYLKYQDFQSAVEQKVIKIASKMSELYNSRCSEKNSLCLVKSYNQCLGTDYKQCIQYGKATCYTSRNYVSQSSGIRFPNTIDPDQLSNNQKLFVCASTQLDATFKEIRNEMKSLTNRLYIGTYFGYFRAFPGLQQQNVNGVCVQKQSDKDGYDPRTRRWYNQATTSDIKNVIIIIDNTASMFGPHLYQAQKVAKDIVNSLNPQDHVGIVTFSNNATYIKYQTLTRASSEVITDMKKSIDELKVGTTDFRSYQEAFFQLIDMLSISKLKGNGFKCLQNSANVVIFLTVGRPNINQTQSQKLIEQINSYNTNKTRQLNTKPFNFTLFTYSIGKNTDNSILQSLSSAYFGTFLSPNLTTSDLKSKMRSYYVYISENTKLEHPVWSDPYFDATTNQRVVSASMPVFYQEDGMNKILGVAAVCVPMSSFTIYGIDENIYNKKKIIHNACQKKQLNICQLQKLRLENNMEINQTCKNVSLQNSTCIFNVKSSLMASPPVSGQIMYQCCPGDRDGMIVGISLGAFTFVFLIVLGIFLYRKCQPRISLLRNNSEEANDQQLPPNASQPLPQPIALDTNNQLSIENLQQNPIHLQAIRRDKFRPINQVPQSTSNAVNRSGSQNQQKIGNNKHNNDQTTHLNINNTVIPQYDQQRVYVSIPEGSQYDVKKSQSKKTPPLQNPHQERKLRVIPPPSSSDRKSSRNQLQFQHQNRHNFGSYGNLMGSAEKFNRQSKY